MTDTADCVIPKTDKCLAQLNDIFLAFEDELAEQKLQTETFLSEHLQNSPYRWVLGWKRFGEKWRLVERRHSSQKLFTLVESVPEVRIKAASLLAFLRDAIEKSRGDEATNAVRLAQVALDELQGKSLE